MVTIGKRTRTNWARKVRKLDMGDRDGGHVKVVHQLERLRGLGLGKKWIEDEEERIFYTDGRTDGRTDQR